MVFESSVGKFCNIFLTHCKFHTNTKVYRVNICSLTYKSTQSKLFWTCFSGATLGKGLNRGLATFVAGAFGCWGLSIIFFLVWKVENDNSYLHWNLIGSAALNESKSTTLNKTRKQQTKTRGSRKSSLI